MTVLRGADADRFLAAPRPDRPIVLVYGPDSGLVSERCRALVGALGLPVDDPFAVVRLDGDVVARDPARLTDEARTLPMFGGRRLIWVSGGDRPYAAAVSPLLAEPPKDATILLEAGDLKKNAPLRVEAEKSPHAAVIACYADGEADLRRLIADEARQAGLAVEPEAMVLLAAMLGGDRAASRAEIRKICLYCHGQQAITAADVQAVAGDSQDLGVNDIVDAALGGQTAELDALLARSSAMGLPSQQVLTVLSRHITALHKALLVVEGGSTRRQAAERFEPPVYGPRRDRIERQLALWTPHRLERVMERVAEAGLDARIRSRMADTIAARTLLSLASQAQARGASR